MQARLVVLLAGALAAVATPLQLQAADTYKIRLEWVPIGGAERNDVSGQGSATAKLTGSTLSLEGAFTGLPGKVTAAKLHQGVATGARGRGVVVGELRVMGDTSGSVAGEIRLNAEQRAALEAGRLYLQIYSEKGVLPDHATLWGWLLP
jgi:hypothetical protein